MEVFQKFGQALFGPGPSTAARNDNTCALRGEHAQGTTWDYCGRSTKATIDPLIDVACCLEEALLLETVAKHGDATGRCSPICIYIDQMSRECERQLASEQ